MGRNFPAVWLLPLVLVMAVGCTNPDNGKGVASVNGSTTSSATPGAAATPGHSGLERALQYTRCMREHGVPMKDPRLNGPNDLVVGEIEGPEPDKFITNKAEEACKQYHDTPDDDTPVPPIKMEHARQLARCMREHGVEHFPDPDPSGSFRADPSMENDPQYQTANKTCSDELAKTFRPGPSESS